MGLAFTLPVHGHPRNTNFKPPLFVLSSELALCVRCGSELAEDASFCQSCGSPIQHQQVPEQSSGQGPNLIGTSTLPVAAFTLEAGPRGRNRKGLDLFFKDTNGQVLLIARGQSAIAVNQRYALLNVNESPAGYIETSGGLVHSSLCVQDFAHNVQGYVRVGGGHPRGTLPPCSIENANGEKLASISGSPMSFSALKPDGSRLFDAVMATEGDLRATLTALAHKALRINLFDPAFSKLVLLGVFTALSPGI